MSKVFTNKNDPHYDILNYGFSINKTSKANLFIILICKFLYNKVITKFTYN